MGRDSERALVNVLMESQNAAVFNLLIKIHAKPLKHVESGHYGKHGVVALCHADLESRPESDHVLVVHQAKEAVSEATKMYHHVTPKLVPHGPLGNHGVPVLRHVVVVFSVEPVTVSMVASMIVLVMRQRNVLVKPTHVQDGQTGVFGVHVLPAVTAVRPRLAANVLMAQQVNAVVLASQVCQAHVTQSPVLNGQTGASSADVLRHVMEESRLSKDSATMVFLGLIALDHMRIFKCVTNMLVPLGQAGVAGPTAQSLVEKE